MFKPFRPDFKTILLSVLGHFEKVSPLSKSYIMSLFYQVVPANQRTQGDMGQKGINLGEHKNQSLKSVAQFG